MESIVTKPNVPAVLYPRLSVAVCADPEKTGVNEKTAQTVPLLLNADPAASGLISFNPPLSHLDARTLMGWTPEAEGGEKFGDDYLLLDKYNRKVRCTNNVRNRPYYESLADDRAQDILNRRFEFNAEPMLVSREGWVLDGQHTCGGLVRAYERWLLDRDEKGNRIWLEQWPEDKYPDGPTIDKVIIYGISSADAVVNTMNTGKPRSLADVLYRSPYFASLPARDSKTGVDRLSAGRVTSSAISHVWSRTGMYLSNFGSRRTTAEAVAWLESHGGTKGKFLAGVKHVLECDKDDRVSSLVSLGYAACVLWLQACSTTDEDKVGKYYSDDERSGKRLNFGQWDKAVEFWSEFGKTKDDEPVGPLKELTASLRAINDSEEEGANANLERNYVITRAWNRFAGGKKVRDEDAKLVYLRADRHGIRRLDESPELGGRLLGGIDLGTEKVARPEPSPEQQQQAEPDVKKKTDIPVTGIAADGIESIVTDAMKASDAQCVLVKTPSGGYAAWGDATCAVIEPYVTKKPRMHPRGLRAISFRADETEQLVEHLTGAGLSVALVSESLAPVNGDPKYVVETVFRPKKTKGGA